MRVSESSWLLLRKMGTVHTSDIFDKGVQGSSEDSKDTPGASRDRAKEEVIPDREHCKDVRLEHRAKIQVVSGGPFRQHQRCTWQTYRKWDIKWHLVALV